MKRKSYSKINLTLDIIKKREDGYHELKMIMLPLELHDEMEFTINNSGKTIIETIIGPKIENNENIIYKTVELMRSLNKFNEGINVKINKHIPLQSGLGGGSSNAATTINVVNELLQLDLKYKDKLCIAKQVGADVPFFLTNKTAIVEGIGEKVTPIKSIKAQVLLVKPKEGINTKKAYEMYGFVGGDHGNFDEVIEAYNKDDLSSLGERVYNSLERAAFKIESNIEILKNELLKENCEVVLMSGSGSTIFVMSKNIDKINHLKEKYQNKGYQTITTEVKYEKRK
jgi:4-diphosphocytidyl-2C-methyl-D-erythritol kinase